MKQSTSDPLKKPNFILQILFAYFKGSGQTGKAVVPGGAAVDKLFCQGNFVMGERSPTSGTHRAGGR